MTQMPGKKTTRSDRYDVYGLYYLAVVLLLGYVIGDEYGHGLGLVVVGAGVLAGIVTVVILAKTESENDA